MTGRLPENKSQVSAAARFDSGPPPTIVDGYIREQLTLKGENRSSRDLAILFSKKIMKAIVDTHIRIPRSKSYRREIKQLRRKLTLDNPEYINRLKLGKSTWKVADKIEAYVLTDVELIVPRGSVHLVKKLFPGITFNDRRTVGTALSEAIALPFELREYQREAVSEMKKKQQGVVIIPCGGGKTVVAVDLIRRVRTSAIILVHTLDLLSQWKDVLKNAGVNAGQIGNGKCEVKPVTIAMVQTLFKKLNEFDREWYEQWGCLITDEVHHCPARTFQQVVNKFPAKYRIGLSATPEREDGLTPLMYFTFGDPVYEIERKALVKGGYLTPVSVQPIHTEFEYPYYGPADMAAMLDELVKDGDRNAHIVAEVFGAVDAGHTCLVLTGRVEHAEYLHRKIQSLGISVAVLLGKVKKADREKVRKNVLNGKIKVIVATTVADEGLDIPNLSAVFFTFPGKAQARILQRAGRIMRPSPGKPDAIIFDFVDLNITPLKRQYFQRRKAYHQLRATILDGYDCVHPIG